MRDYSALQQLKMNENTYQSCHINQWCLWAFENLDPCDPDTSKKLGLFYKKGSSLTLPIFKEKNYVFWKTDKNYFYAFLQFLLKWCATAHPQHHCKLKEWLVKTVNVVFMLETYFSLNVNELTVYWLFLCSFMFINKIKLLCDILATLN